MKQRRKKGPVDRDTLIGMAADMFRAKGFDGTTLDEISGQAGVSRFKLYAWFGSKEGILKAAFNATWARINEELTAKLRAEMDFRQTLEVLLFVILDFAERRDPIAAMFLEFSRREGVDGHLQPEVLRFNRIIEDAVNAARENVRQGETLGEPLAKSKVFPPMVTRMITIGERSGALEKLLSKIAEFYDQQVKATVEGLTALIEPLMIGVMGFIVGGIVLAIFLPIFKLQAKLQSGG